MSLTISVPDEMAAAVEELAARCGQTPEQLLLNALRAHFPLIPVELQDEFDALERASDEDYARFEQEEQDSTNATG